MRKFVPLVLFFVFVFMSIFVFWKIFPIKHRDIIVKYCGQYNLQPQLVCAVINAESGFEERAVSNVGAVGLMQVMPSTASEIATKFGVGEYNLNEPNTNIWFGCYYLNYLLELYEGDIITSLCAYNAGLNNVSQWSAFDGSIESIPVAVTKKYVKKILNHEKIYSIFYFH